MCVVCRQMKQKDELIRICRQNGQFIIDLNYKVNGRGAYVCKNKECIERACAKKMLNKSFKIQVPEEIYTNIKSFIYDNK